MQLSPFPCHLVPLRSKCFPQYPILKHPQPAFLPQCQRPGFTPIQNHGQNYSSICRVLLQKKINFRNCCISLVLLQKEKIMCLSFQGPVILEERISAFGSWCNIWGKNRRGVCWSHFEPMVSRLVRGGDVTLGYRRLGHTYIALFPGLTASLCYCGNDKMPTNPSPRLPA